MADSHTHARALVTRTITQFANPFAVCAFACVCVGRHGQIGMFENFSVKLLVSHARKSDREARWMRRNIAINTRVW